jgi:predicted transposase YbfD/YdcC
MKRTVKVYQATFEKKEQFKGLQRFISIEREVEREGKHQTTLSYHISSLQASARRFAHGIVFHRGGIENRLHWVKDVVFKEDDSSITMGAGPQNFSILRNIAINIFSNQGFKSMTSAIRFVADSIPSLIKLLI